MYTNTLGYVERFEPRLIIGAKQNRDYHNNNSLIIIIMPMAANTSNIKTIIKKKTLSINNTKKHNIQTSRSIN